MKHKICLIIVYFGKLPFWLPAFQLSCGYNPEVDWLIFIDDKAPPNPPDNVTYHHSSWECFNATATKKLGYKVNLNGKFPYKICDYKPVLGKIYEDYLDAYDFWGHCDIDVIWGNIKKFVSERLLNNYDIITSRPNRISGHFCIYKNQQRLKELFAEVPKVRRILSDSYHHCGLTESELTKHIRKSNRNRWIQKLLTGFIKKQQAPPLKIYWDRIWASAGWQQQMVSDEKKLFLKWQNGKAFHVDGTELMYLHFHKLKGALNDINFGYYDTPSEVNITERAILSV